MSSTRIVAALAGAVIAAACSKTSPSSDASATVAARDTNGVPFAYQRIPLDTSHTPGATIDSVFPMPEMVKRFRSGLPRLSSLQGGDASRQALVTHFVSALAASDRITLGQLVLSRAEFAWLYYPNSRDATMPNGLPPQRRWDQVTLNSEKGIGRALTRLGGKPITLESLDCPNPPVTTGAQKLHDGCTVKLTLADGTTFSGPLFGSIIEYAGRFKFVSYTNDM